MKKIKIATLAILMLFGAVTTTHAEVKSQMPQKVLADNQEKNDIYYEVFVRSFADSNGDGIGDLNGLTKKLDYINDGNKKTQEDLGATAIWLMPIQPSPTYHKYNVSDHRTIDPEYGTMENFQRLLDEAHKRGIKIIMDLAVNHTSMDHPWFKEAQNKDSKYRNYYLWADENTDVTKTGPWGQRVWHKDAHGDYYFGMFGSNLPDLNFDNPEVVEEMNKIGQYWVGKGVDGFRLDAAKHIYQDAENMDDHVKNVKWWVEFQKAIQEVNPAAYMVGEVWDDPEIIAPYYKGMDSMFNFDLSEKIIESVMTGENHDIAVTQAEMAELYKKTSGKDTIDGVFLRNHDDTRVMTAFDGDSAKAKMASSILMTLPGNPFIYYGEEIGMRGAKPDPNIREPFQWGKQPTSEETSWMTLRDNANVPGGSVEEQTSNKYSLLSHYRKMISVRKSSKALMKGQMTPIHSNNKHILAFARTYKNERVVVIHNLSNSKEKVNLATNLKGAKVLFTTSDKKIKTNYNKDKVDIILPAGETVILK